MVWDIQIVLDAFIFVMLKLGVDRCIRCGARRGARVALLDCVNGSFLIIFNLDHVDEVARLRLRSVHKTQIQAALQVVGVAGGSVLQAVGLDLVVLRRGFVLGEPETRREGWPATSRAPLRSRCDHEICTKSCRTTGPSWSGRSIVGSGYLLIRLTLNRTYQSQGFSELGADPIDGVEQVGVVDLPPFVAGKRMMSCRRG